MEFPRQAREVGIYVAILLSNHGGIEANGQEQRILDTFRTLAVLDVGRNPRQIRFSTEGETAFIAASGSDQVAAVDVRQLQILEFHGIPDAPFGLAVLSNGDLAISRFKSDRVSRHRAGRWLTDHLITGKSPSLLVGPLPNGNYLVAAEATDRLWVANLEKFTLLDGFTTGQRPMPPSVTSNGQVAFVPNYEDGTVSVFDLSRRMTKRTLEIGDRPGAGAVLPGNSEYAVAIQGEDHIAFVDIERLEITSRIAIGVGDSPSSVITSPDGQFAFINNVKSDDISVLDLRRREVTARLKVGAAPVHMAIHPAGETLWISCEAEHRVYVIALPRQFNPEPTPIPVTIDMVIDRPEKSGLDLSNQDRCGREIRELHRFFEDWFNGNADPEPDFRRLEGVLADSFSWISPLGSVASKDETLILVRNAKGGSADQPVRIQIMDLTCRSLTDTLYLATYEQWQTVARQSRRRKSTAVLRDAPGLPHNLQWIHLHETQIED